MKNFINDINAHIFNYNPLFISMNFISDRNEIYFLEKKTILNSNIFYLWIFSLNLYYLYNGTEEFYLRKEIQLYNEKDKKIKFKSKLSNNFFQFVSNQNTNKNLIAITNNENVYGINKKKLYKKINFIFSYKIK